MRRNEALNAAVSLESDSWRSDVLLNYITQFHEFLFVVIRREIVTFAFVLRSVVMRRHWLVVVLGGVFGGLVFFLIYTLANNSLTLDLYQRILPVSFGIVSGGFLADAVYKRTTERNQNGAMEEDERTAE